MSIDKVKQDLIAQGLTSEQDWKERVVGRINEILRLLFLQAKSSLDARYGCFEILAVDFLISEDDLNPYLMEINSNPSLQTDMDDSREFIKTLIRDVVTLACDLHEGIDTRGNAPLFEKVFRCA